MERKTSCLAIFERCALGELLLSTNPVTRVSYWFCRLCLLTFCSLFVTFMGALLLRKWATQIIHTIFGKASKCYCGDLDLCCCEDFLTSIYVPCVFLCFYPKTNVRLSEVFLENVVIPGTSELLLYSFCTHPSFQPHFTVWLLGGLQS